MQNRFQKILIKISKVSREASLKTNSTETNMKKFIISIVIFISSLGILSAQTVTGKLVNQAGTGLSGLQLSLYENSKVHTTESNSDGSFTFNDFTGLTNAKLPIGYAVYDCFPNPFSRTTSIKVTLGKEGIIKIDVYNLLGQKVMAVIDQHFDAGDNYIDVDLGGLEYGSYLCKTTIDDRYTVTGKMLFQEGCIQSTAINKSVGLRYATENHVQGTNIDSLVVKGASIGKKVFLNLQTISGESLNLGILTVTETNNILDGALFFNSSVTTVGLVSYHEGGRLVTDSAYLGQVFAYFSASVDESGATSIINAAGGSILSKVPKIGYYLVGVPIGKEGQCIDFLKNNKSVKNALPNPIAKYMSKGVTVIDGCGGSHGSNVGCTVRFNTVNFNSDTCLDDDDGNGKPDTEKTIKQILKTIAAANGGNAIINISSFGGLNSVDYEKEDTATKAELLRMAKKYLQTILTPISQLPESWTKNLVITFSAGNDNTPLSSVLSEIRSDSLQEVLNNNVLIVGANESIYHDSNDAPGDPCFANMRSVTSSCNINKKGTSFAAPLAAAYIWNLVKEKEISANQALHAVKIAIANNSKKEFIEAEAMNIAGLMKRGNVYSGGPFSLTQTSLQSNGDYTYDTLTIVNKFYMTVVLNGDSSFMVAPSHLSWSWKAYITEDGNDSYLSLTDQVIKNALTVSNNTFTGNSTTIFPLYFEKSGMQVPFQLTSGFIGTFGPNETITGTMGMKFSNKKQLDQSTVVTMKKL